MKCILCESKNIIQCDRGFYNFACNDCNNFIIYYDRRENKILNYIIEFYTDNTYNSIFAIWEKNPTTWEYKYNFISLGKYYPITFDTNKDDFIDKILLKCKLSKLLD